MSDRRKQDPPVLAVATIVKHHDEVLQARRHGGRGDGTWEHPGGKVDPGERMRKAACRELFEEAGIFAAEHMLQPLEVVEIQRPKFLVVVHFFVVDFTPYGRPEALNPEENKRGDWRWVKKGDLPRPQFHDVLQTQPRFW